MRGVPNASTPSPPGSTAAPAGTLGFTTPAEAPPVHSSKITWPEV
jgi:hypothetical protein